MFSSSKDVATVNFVALFTGVTATLYSWDSALSISEQRERAHGPYACDNSFWVFIVIYLCQPYHRPQDRMITKKNLDILIKNKDTFKTE